MPVKLETENVKETEASADLVRELMADDARRGNWLILMHDDDEEAFVQIAFDDHPDGIDLEYRDGADECDVRFQTRSKPQVALYA